MEGFISQQEEEQVSWISKSLIISKIRFHCFPSLLLLHSHSGAEFGDLMLKTTGINPVNDFINSHPSM